MLAAVPKERHDEVRADLNLIFYGATSLEQAKAHLETFRKQYSKIYPTAVECLMRDIDQVLMFYLLPAFHWKRIRTSNCLERMNQEIKRRLRVIGRHPSEEGCLALVYKITQNYSDRRKFKVDDLTNKLWTRLREEKESMLRQVKIEGKAA